jgi:hypothetical protein
MDERARRWRRTLAEVFEDRPVVLAGGTAAGANARVVNVRRFGARRCLVLATGRGTGPLPAPEDADVVVHEIPPAADVPASIRLEEEVFADPPVAFVEALDRFDPDRRAIVLPPPFAALTEVAGRAVYGGRRPEWVALEDKTTVDAVLEAAGVPVPPYEVVDAEPAAAIAAAARLDRGAGTVWSGDARDGFNGGAAYVRWVRDEADAREAQDRLGASCARIRVAPFVEGIPSGIHGMVTDDGVAVFRPVELLTLRRSCAPRLCFAGGATYWDPRPADRVAMRDAARRLGAELRARVDYRGVYTIDGIMGADGWVATEYNPRFGAGFAYARIALPDVPIDLVHHAVIAGDARGLRAADVEAAVVPGADAYRWGAAWLPVATEWPESATVHLAGDESGYRVADGADRDATLSYGPGPTGGFVRCEFAADRTPRGASIAARAVAALAFADQHAGAGIGTLQSAVAVR